VADWPAWEGRERSDTRGMSRSVRTAFNRTHTHVMARACARVGQLRGCIHTPPSAECRSTSCHGSIALQGIASTAVLVTVTWRKGAQRSWALKRSDQTESESAKLRCEMTCPWLTGRLPNAARGRCDLQHAATCGITWQRCHEKPPTHPASEPRAQWCSYLRGRAAVSHASARVRS
jgi:hypothetical protein